MSGGYGSSVAETFQSFLFGCAKFLMWAGGLAVLVSTGFLIFTAAQSAGLQPQQIEDARRNIEILGKVLSVGVLGLGVGASYLFWGEEVLGASQLIAAGALFFAPMYVPMMLGEPNQISGLALGAIQQGGLIYGIVALVVTITDVAIRIRERSKIGVKADHLKYGKGVKEEKDKQNVFMGKCWQLPFCRKYVRERCPIYHSKRTCWKELVGCMCEEQVIRNAMENKPIPKDELLAVKMIPQNHKLTAAAKRERCKSCVIYNEHQRHKYKLWMPLTMILIIAGYVVFRGPLLDGTLALATGINRVVQAGTLGAAGNFEPPRAFVEMLLGVFVIVLLSYTLKVLEYLIFKAKV
jgi:hypothetical protein